MAEYGSLRRRDLGALGLSAAALVAFQSSGNAQEEKSRQQPGHDSGFDACAAACNACQLECDACFHHCMMMLADGNKKHTLTLQTCNDCASLCSAAAQITARKGPFSNVTCEACAEACAMCAEECEKFPDDEHMVRCAKECRRCEKACRDLVKNAGQGIVR